MTEKLMHTQDIFLDRINQICGKFGLNNIMAQLYAILYLSDKPMSLNDMVERLKISKGSASINIRALERYGAVKRVWVKGSRKDYYEAEMDIVKVVMERAKSIAQNRLSEIADVLNASRNAADIIIPSSKEEKDAIDLLRQKLDNLYSLQNKAAMLYNLFNSKDFFGNLFDLNNVKKDAKEITV